MWDQKETKSGRKNMSRIVVSKTMFKQDCGITKSLRSRNKLEEKLNFYKNSEIKKSFNTTNFLLPECKGITSFRIHFANDLNESAVSSAALKRLMNICKRADCLITEFSEEFLETRNIYKDQKCDIKDELKKIIIKKTENILFLENSVNDVTIVKKNLVDSGISDERSSSEVTKSPFKLESSEGDSDSDLIVVKEYCHLCGENFNLTNTTITNTSKKRIHKCENDYLTKRIKNERYSSVSNLKKFIEEPTKIYKNDNVEKINRTNEVGLSPSSPLQIPNLTEEIPTGETGNSPISSITCKMQTSTPIITREVACNTSNTTIDKNTTIFSQHNTTNSLLESPRMKRILEYLDKRYAHAVTVNNNNSFSHNMNKSELETIKEEGAKIVEPISEKEKQLNNNSSSINNNNNNDIKIDKDTIDLTENQFDEKDEFEPKCVDNSCIKHIFGYNFYGSRACKKNGLRLIVIDGSNVALGHSKGKIFSSEGLKICIDYFIRRGHQVKAFVPQFRLKRGQSSNPQMLKWMYKKGWVVFTPSREINGRMIVSYDDRYIVQCAAIHDAVIVSNDLYRDLIEENHSWKETIENNLLMVTWVDNVIYFPPDPLGRRGPPLEKFLTYN